MPIDLDNIKALIAKSGKTNTQIAHEADMLQPALSRLLAGKRPDPQISTIDRLAKVLGVKARRLIK